MAKKEAKAGPVAVRMLQDWGVDGVMYRGDDIVQFDGNIAEQLCEAGCADDAPEAVDYIKSIGGVLKIHLPVQPAQPANATGA